MLREEVNPWLRSQPSSYRLVQFFLDFAHNGASLDMPVF